MKNLLLLLTFFTASSSLYAQQDAWRDPAVNEINRMPMHAAFFAYESPEAALAGDKAQSERFLSLAGDWKFCWVRNATERPRDFFRVDFDDAGWGTMPVPGIWELNGYGDPVYLNIGYAWREQFKNNPPYAPEAENHVGTYRREIDIPASWNGQQVLAHFGSVTSNISLWVNGRFVGYSEDSKLSAEFDLTPYLRPGRNLVAFQVFRWCDGTYLEDQDFFRLSGVARECYLYARDKRHVADLQLHASLTDNYTKGLLDVKAEFPQAARGCVLEVALSDAAGRRIAATQRKVAGREVRMALDAGSVQAWSAERPRLYNVTATLKNPSDEILEVITQHVGFRNVAIEGGQLLVNGKPVLIKGANRHEMDPDGGYVVSEARMMQDIRILKENNFNAVRTCHYPDDNRWYDLCDRYGLYIVAEANVESHGMGYDEATLAAVPAYAKAHMERNERNVKNNFNHPSVIIWSLGNEAGDGPNFDACYDWIKAYDPSRPVQYERGIYRENGRNTDIVCPMYMNYKSCEEYALSNPSKPLIQCEYAHAMGNSMGGFKEYWELIRKYPAYQGGFIWDFVDQSLRKTGKGDVMVYGYGGDWNPYDASDFNFCDNGLISPDRVPNPHMNEVRYFQQPIWVRGVDASTGHMRVYNEYFFRDLSDCRLEWRVLCDGRVVRSGVVSQLDVAPQSEKTIQLPFTLAELPASGELLLNVDFRLEQAEEPLPAGHTIASQQLVLRDAKLPPLSVEAEQLDRHTSAGTLALRDNDHNYLIAEGSGLRIDFNRQTGFMTRYEAAGVSYLDEGSSLRPNFWRAPTDNDFGARLQQKNRVWDNPQLKLTSMNGAMKEGCVEVTAEYEIPAVAAKLKMTYRINNTGKVLVTQEFRTAGGTKIPDMLRFGMRMEMPKTFDRIDYYGRGPWENYSDRKESAFVGRYSQRVSEQPYSYIRPQETGTKSDVRWWHQRDISGRGLRVVSAEAFSASALNYSQESLDEGLVKHQGHSQEVTPQDRVFLCIDKAQSGLGCIDSWGARPKQEYQLPYGDYSFTFLLAPETQLR